MERLVREDGSKFNLTVYNYVMFMVTWRMPQSSCCIILVFHQYRKKSTNLISILAVNFMHLLTHSATPCQ